MSHARHGTNQVDLGAALRNLFPAQYVISNARNFGALVQVENGTNLELDYWIPELKLAFEFQDPHHYVASLYSHEPLRATQQKDHMKKEILLYRGETLIAVPCWWDGNENSLAYSILFARPDLLLDWRASACVGGPTCAAGEGIPLVPPLNYFEDMIPNVGHLLQPMFANNTFNLAGWWIGEKYDGIRACWNVESKQLYLRSGKVLVLPEAFKQDFPPIYLDGEIWFGKGSFHEPQTLVLNNADGPAITWHSLKFVVFDDAMSDSPFEQRFGKILCETEHDHPFIIETAMHKAQSTEYVHKALKELLLESGEGIIVRMPNSFYVCGRTDSVMKFKSHKDQEALVLEIEDNSVGDMTCILKLNNDVTITAQYNAVQDDPFANPQPGDIVTFCYNIVNSQGTPSNAVILRVRKDLTWDDVVSSNTREAELVNLTESALIKRTRKVAGYWTNDDNKNTRTFLNEFAHSRNFDPLVPHNWLEISTRDVIAAGGVGFLSNYNGSLIKCLVDVYPDIGIRISTRNKLPQRYWQEHENRKHVFDTLAKKMKFDPLIQKNWYWVTRRHIYAEKGGSSMLDYYDGSIGDALKDIYPSVPWYEPNFYRKYWHEPLNRRKFFDSYARAMGFDPLVAANWYSVTTASVLKHAGGHAVMEFHKSLQTALQELYPSLDLAPINFHRMQSGYWNNATRRDFFDKFAQGHGFEPLIARNWYKYNATHITAVKGGVSALQSYGGSLIKAIIDLYPDITLDLTLFNAVPARHWRDAANRKAMLEQVAKQKGLDPLIPSTWYTINAKAIKKIGGGRHLLKETKGLQNALLEAFPNMKPDPTLTRAKASITVPSIWHHITSASVTSLNVL
eukprot:Phypoly_transcript_02681.p1 GENE.Phypoly_transcript_02681~~Phypoly_transcript_02681.p1  ORF type:complete len:850 (+),score=89.37 Phypoly_transcript_02681:125-2674(+)